MSRWYVIDEDLVNLRVQIAHWCPGSHTPWAEWVTPRIFEGITNLMSKPTRPCYICDISKRAAPHLPGPYDYQSDRERYVPNKGILLADEMMEEWLRK